MKGILKKHLEKLRKVKRKEHHHLLFRIHKKHKISKKTLFYVKEYGPHTHISRTIIKESLKILFFASIVSSLGGLALENIKTNFIPIIPLVILLPALNGVIGGYGTIISSKLSTMLHEGKIKKKWEHNLKLRKLFIQLILISSITSILSVVISLVSSSIFNYKVSLAIASKILFIVLIDVLLLVTIIFLVAIFAGLYFFKKKEDPNNFLIPITTSIADFGNMIILAILVIILF